MCVLRGIRAISDYEYELQMALMNRKLEPDAGNGVHDAGRQIFLCQFAAGAGSGAAGGPVKGLVPEMVEQKLREKLEPGIQAAGSHRSEDPRSRKKRMTTVTHVQRVKLTERINRIEPSATMAVVAEADKLRQQGIDVVDFGAGEPHFSTPQHIKDAAIAAIQNNFTKYTAVGGTAELRDAIVHRHAVDFDSDYRREEVDRVRRRQACAVQRDSGAGRSRRRSDSAGAVLGFVQRHRSLCRRKLRVCWRPTRTQGFRVTAQMVERLITPRTKLIILNSPSNPSGAVMSSGGHDRSCPAGAPSAASG